MDSEEKKQRQRALKTLRAAEVRHAELLAKVGKARAKLEARRRELRTLEAEIASLTRRVYQPVNGASPSEASGTNVRSARLIFNPDAHGTKPLKDIIKRLRAHGIVADVDLKLSDAFVEEVAKEAVEAEEDLLIVVAGDNTVQNAARQLNNSQTALGIIPIGQTNRIAEALKIPEDIEAASTLIGTAQPRRVNLGQILKDEQNVPGTLLVIAPEAHG